MRFFSLICYVADVKQLAIRHVPLWVLVIASVVFVLWQTTIATEHTLRSNENTTGGTAQTYAGDPVETTITSKSDTLEMVSGVETGQGYAVPNGWLEVNNGDGIHFAYPADFRVSRIGSDRYTVYNYPEPELWSDRFPDGSFKIEFVRIPSKLDVDTFVANDLSRVTVVSQELISYDHEDAINAVTISAQVDETPRLVSYFKATNDIWRAILYGPDGSNPPPVYDRIMNTIEVE